MFLRWNLGLLSLWFSYCFCPFLFSDSFINKNNDWELDSKCFSSLWIIYWESRKCWYQFHFLQYCSDILFNIWFLCCWSIFNLKFINSQISFAIWQLAWYFKSKWICYTKHVNKVEFTKTTCKIGLIQKSARGLIQANNFRIFLEQTMCIDDHLLLAIDTQLMNSRISQRFLQNGKFNFIDELMFVFRVISDLLLVRLENWRKIYSNVMRVFVLQWITNTMNQLICL